MGDCKCDCNCTPKFNDEVLTYNPIFGSCGGASSEPTVIIYDGGDASGYDEEDS